MAGGQVSLKDIYGDTLLHGRFAGDNRIACIPLKATERLPGRVAHLLPICGAARDLFTGGMSLLVINTARGRAHGPDLTILRALFDLTPAEASIAATLATGADLKSAASRQAIKFSTARSYLETIFLKTSCRRQGELVAMLLGITAPAGALPFEQ